MRETSIPLSALSQIVNYLVLCVSLEALTNGLTMPLNFAATKLANFAIVRGGAVPKIRWNFLGSLNRVRAHAGIPEASQLCTGSISGVS